MRKPLDKAPVSPEAFEFVSERYGHDVPGFISGELLGGLDPITKMRVMIVFAAMAEDLLAYSEIREG